MNLSLDSSELPAEVQKFSLKFKNAETMLSEVSQTQLF